VNPDLFLDGSRRIFTLSIDLAIKYQRLFEGTRSNLFFLKIKYANFLLRKKNCVVLYSFISINLSEGEGSGILKQRQYDPIPVPELNNGNRQLLIQMYVGASLLRVDFKW
jgi:hypothetical protein